MTSPISIFLFNLQTEFKVMQILQPRGTVSKVIADKAKLTQPSSKPGDSKDSLTDRTKRIQTERVERRQYGQIQMAIVDYNDRDGRITATGGKILLEIMATNSLP